ncbi:hypothetical protein AK830_g5717 [Neonectria ditissima]|uniref:Uncharacterized protein n=1 Tax=Neonectria ditissima TaxID=78410 RepID=A0A0P7ASQ0_9HYPO|nr:hypothetical protein AK830_g5717 [Neonectria ditissima]
MAAQPPPQPPQLGAVAAPAGQQPNPQNPGQRRCIIVHQTITAEAFVAEHQKWLRLLLEPDPPLKTILPPIFRYLTKDTMRFLPGPYNDKLHKLFSSMGDSERSSWCFQAPLALGVITREMYMPTSFDLNKIKQVSARMWQIGNFLNCNGIVHGGELERMSWQLEGLLAFAHANRPQAQATQPQAQAIQAPVQASASTSVAGVGVQQQQALHTFVPNQTL